jgi:hypothetical protein
MTIVTVTQVARNFAEYVNRVAYRHESFTLVRGKQLLAELRPVPAGSRLSELPGLLGVLPRLTPAEAEAFARDIELAYDELGEVRDPWES